MTMRFFALDGSEHLGTAIASAMGVTLDPHEERDFEDGEHKTRPLISVRGEDVFVLHALNGDPSRSVNDKLIRLLFFIAACRENGAARISAIVPYIAYSRKERQTKPRDPVTTRYVAQLFEAVGTDMVVTLDVHNIAAFQNAFRCATTHLDTCRLFAADIQQRASGAPVVIFSPDGGGVKRAQLVQEAYEDLTGEAAGFGFIEKRRSGGIVSGSLFAGDVDGASVCIIDDMISTGGTMLRAARACRERGARQVTLYAAHGLFVAGSETVLNDSAFDRIVVTDSVAPFRPEMELVVRLLDVLPVAPIFAQAIMRLHGGGSIHRLLASDS